MRTVAKKSCSQMARRVWCWQMASSVHLPPLLCQTLCSCRDPSLSQLCCMPRLALLRRNGEQAVLRWPVWPADWCVLQQRWGSFTSMASRLVCVLQQRSGSFTSTAGKGIEQVGVCHEQVADASSLTGSSVPGMQKRKQRCCDVCCCGMGTAMVKITQAVLCEEHRCHHGPTGVHEANSLSKPLPRAARVKCITSYFSTLT